MPNSREEAARAFKSLHATRGGFIMPNAWDGGSAAVLAGAGFPAIATTSAGIAFALARQDYSVTSAALAVPREEMFDHIRQSFAQRTFR
jgi:2-methylisocitrate lyase-like PEP mutase family enzyme